MVNRMGGIEERVQWLMVQWNSLELKCDSLVVML